MDLSNAFEDGKTCLERLETRRKAGKVSEREEASVMEALKERIREEYRKVKSTTIWTSVGGLVVVGIFSEF